ncbi:beta-carotene 15,15'-monooxygenase [Arcobacter lacus]|uniref:Beta-carotene 15,15'-monooxygenase n=1 Tax=Arcobacter lacus TaxID=1912876 RepID=A0ABX5JIG4_9BACT|nr:beta-carotene 15,15'-monooxygenase [Arcobacter lacus]PUE66190.1 beta-carotene 15,15'-monooxygenase [Arcobacter lacus]
MSGKNHNQIDLKEAKNIIIDSLKYLFVVAIICTIIPVILRFDIKFFGNFNQENSLIEYFQLIFLFSTIVIFVRLSKKRPDLKYASMLIAAFYLVLFIRENDDIFDLVYHGFWAPWAGFVALIAIIYTFKDWKKGVLELATYLKIPDMKLMIFSVMFLVVFSRLFGMGSFWKHVMKDNYVYEVKAMIEEGTELLAYGLILYSAYLIYKYLVKEKI